MNKLRDIQATRKSKLDLADDLIKTHIRLYGEYKNNDDFIEKILKDAQELKEKEIMINELIENIHDPITKAFIKEKFVNGENWERISEKIGYSESYLYKLYNRAMKNPEIAEIKEILSR